MKSAPEKLYRYRPPSEYTLKNLRKGQIWFSTPSTFNDPFDCAVRVDTKDASEEEYWEVLRYFQSEMGDPDQIVNQFVRNGQLTDDFKELARQGSRKAYRNLVDQMLHQRGAVCFSAVPPDHEDSILQWSHYAQSHKGVCLEFDTKCPLFGEGELYRVNYSNSVPSVGRFDVIIPDNGVSAGDVLRLMIATKADCWEYEREWRIFHKEGNQAYSYSPGCLNAVYIACDAEKAFRKKVESIVQGTNTDLFAMDRPEEEFRLIVQPVNPEST